jgi:hypothetical protein
MSMRIRWLVAVPLAALLAACGKPVPPEKAAYVGYWQGPGMTLSITQEGRIEYKRVEGGSSKSISAPLQGFHGDDFDAGLGPMSTTFKVTAPPHQEGGAMKMTVDGVELTRSP